MINSIGSTYQNTNVTVNESNKDVQVSDNKTTELAPKEIVNKLDQKDLTIKDQVKKLADAPPIDRNLVNEIKTKVEQGRYPIDLDIVTEKMFESFHEAQS
tara:strand:+ start:151 stop:450 length:300 start_codon:yes stop_codon:yes gene_type:complete